MPYIFNFRMSFVNNAAKERTVRPSTNDLDADYDHGDIGLIIHGNYDRYSSRTRVGMKWQNSTKVDRATGIVLSLDDTELMIKALGAGRGSSFTRHFIGANEDGGLLILDWCTDFLTLRICTDALLQQGPTLYLDYEAAQLVVKTVTATPATKTLLH